MRSFAINTNFLSPGLSPTTCRMTISVAATHTPFPLYTRLTQVGTYCAREPIAALDRSTYLIVQLVLTRLGLSLVPRRSCTDVLALKDSPPAATRYLFGARTRPSSARRQNSMEYKICGTGLSAELFGVHLPLLGPTHAPDPLLSSLSLSPQLVPTRPGAREHVARGKAWSASSTPIKASSLHSPTGQFSTACCWQQNSLDRAQAVGRRTEGSVSVSA